MFKNRRINFLKKNVNSLLSKREEKTPSGKVSKCFCNRSQWNKTWQVVLSNEVAIESYDLIRIDCCENLGEITCFMKNTVACSQKPHLPNLTWKVFTEIYV